jgi:hypothetical protein
MISENPPGGIGSSLSGGCLDHPSMFAKPKGISVERRDFSRGKRYSLASSEA